MRISRRTGWRSWVARDYNIDVGTVMTSLLYERYKRSFFEDPLRGYDNEVSVIVFLLTVLTWFSCHKQ